MEEIVLLLGVTDKHLKSHQFGNNDITALS